MHHGRDVIRLKSTGMPTREIARRMGTAPSTLRLMIRRFEAAGLTWPLPDDITNTELEARLFAGAGAGPGTRRGHRRQAEPDWSAVHRELKRKHVTLSIVWEEYIASEPGRYRYSRCVAPGFMLRGGRRARDAGLSLARAAHKQDDGCRPRVPSGMPSTRGARCPAATGGADRKCRLPRTPWPSSPNRPPHRRAWCRARRDPARLGLC
jgi:hypothetical protein